jgi:exopolyphosphatase / guanosine-5'-triphosphate,3'-diphosphate pyrophosphatase
LRVFVLGLKPDPDRAGRPAEKSVPADSANALDPQAPVLAAVDLGSNSFHMIVAREQDGQLVVIDRLREMVRLASALDRSGRLTGDSQERALACLKRFGQRIRDMHAHQVRVVGTNTFRKARNAGEFLAAAETALGHPVEVVSGIEEARLIYLGVAHHVDCHDGATLVVDIGGGSTELIVGERFEPRHLESLSIGAVGISRTYFDDGRITRRRFSKARLAVRLEMQPVTGFFRRVGWARAVGSSGTVRAAAEIAHQLGLVDQEITREALEHIIAEMIAAGHVRSAQLPGLGSDRAPVFPGGLAILVEVMNSLGTDTLQVSDGALREGLLYDMVGRLHDEDMRELSVRAMQRRYHVDLEQADRVESTAMHLWQQVASAWSLHDARYSRLLAWAARLHEVGLDIAHSRYHHHGAYLLANADLPGFDRLEQQQLALLVGHHRRKLDSLSFDRLRTQWHTPMFRLVVLLRLAALLNRSRSAGDVQLPQLKVGATTLRLKFPNQWLADNPLTEADLKRERQWLGVRGFALDVAVDAADAQEVSAS